MTTADLRTEPSTVADERALLEGFLDYHRETLAWKCAGLDDEQLRRAPLAPSELSLLGLVRHLADVERHWFRRVLADEQVPPLHYSEEDPDGEFHVGDQDTWDAAHSTWRAEIARARELTASRSLDDVSARKSKAGEPFSLRWIYHHMIEEYARHNGHADLIREQIDGATGE
ncbi:DinB family protein [Streptomyces sp. NPDC059909]|uniref:DinB family protein n=1 Tax=Streptomyces sp. NPDC059909 TaxID=3346998 RepID=UPI003662D52D